jgi:hypothetical protein
MALNDATLSLIAFKQLQGKSMTDTNKSVGNEAEGIKLNVSADSVFMDEIDSDPAIAVLLGVAQLVDANLTLDPTSNNQAYFATYPIGHPLVGQRVRNVISPTYGAGYEAKPKDNLTNPIAVGDPSDWVYQYNSGIFYMQDPGSVSGIPTTIGLYVYIGTILSDYASIIGDDGDWNITTSDDLQMNINGNILPFSNNLNDIGTPSLRFNDVYLNGTIDYLNNLSIKGNGTNYIRINNTGNVGIHTTNPTETLHLIGSYKQEGGSFVFNDNAGDYDFRAEGTSDQNLFNIDAGLNSVGIGTSLVTGRKFAVTASATDNDDVAIYALQNSSNFGSTTIFSWNGSTSTDVTSVYALSSQFSGTGVGIEAVASSSLGTVNIAGRFIAQSGINNYAIIVPPNSGHVGIGTNSPTALLDVDGSIKFGGLTTIPFAGHVLQSIDNQGNLDWVDINTLISLDGNGIYSGSGFLQQNTTVNGLAGYSLDFIAIDEFTIASNVFKISDIGGVNFGTFDVSGLTDQRNYTLQDASGTIAFLSDIPAAPTTLYTGNGTLTGTRAVTLNQNDLAFNSLVGVKYTSVQINPSNNNEFFIEVLNSTISNTISNSFEFSDFGGLQTSMSGSYYGTNQSNLLQRANVFQVTTSNSTESTVLEMTTGYGRIDSINSLGDSATIFTTLASGGSAGISYQVDSTGDLNKISLSASEMTVLDEINSKGLVYAADYSANYTDRSLVDKEYVDGLADLNGIYTGSGSLSGNTEVTMGVNTLSFEHNSDFNILKGAITPSVTTLDSALYVENLIIGNQTENNRGILGLSILTNQTANSNLVNTGATFSSIWVQTTPGVSLTNDYPLRGVVADVRLVGNQGSVSSMINYDCSSNIQSGTTATDLIGFSFRTNGTDDPSTGTFTNMKGFFMPNLSSGYTGVPAATNRWGLYLNDVSYNYIAGSLGIGLDAPSAKLQIRGAGTTSATNSLLIENSASTELFRVRDDGNIGIGINTPSALLDINGTFRLRNLTTTPAAGYVLQSTDALGNADWVDLNTIIPPVSIDGVTIILNTAGDLEAVQQDIPTKYKETFTPGTLGVPNVINHQLNTEDVLVQLWNNNILISADSIEVVDVNNVEVTFTGSNPIGDVKVTIIGL